VTKVGSTRDQQHRWREALIAPPSARPKERPTRHVLPGSSSEYREGYSEAERAFRIGLAVRERRLALGLSQVQLAARAKMTQPALSRLEAGGVIPTSPLLDRISAALDADLIVQVSPRAAWPTPLPQLPRQELLQRLPRRTSDSFSVTTPKPSAAASAPIRLPEPVAAAVRSATGAGAPPTAPDRPTRSSACPACSWPAGSQIPVACTANV